MPSDSDMNPQQWIEAYRSFQIRGLAVDSVLQESISSGLFKITDHFLCSKEAAKVFSLILGHKGPVAPTLRSMHISRFLDSYLPEFGRVSSLRSKDEAHRFVIGEHTLRAIEVLDGLKTKGRDPEKDLYLEAFNSIQQPELLYLALLLHDIGKGTGGEHSIKGASMVPEISSRLHLNKQDSETISFLVKNHLLMAQTSQRRDLDDPAVIDDFVQKLGQEERLHMLFLLTHSDSVAVGSSFWNEWKESLLYELYIKSRHRYWEKSRGIEYEEVPSSEVMERAANLLEPHLDRWELEEHFEKMPASYFRFLDPKDLVTHLDLVHRVRIGNQPVALRWTHSPRGHCRILMICTLDRIGLFADIVGVMTARGINVLNANAYTREDGIVLDVFVVTHQKNCTSHLLEKEQDVEKAIKEMLIPGRRRDKTEPALLEYCIKDFKAQPLITFSNDASKRYTLLEVEARDTIGLLYTISKCLTRMELNISLARVTTEGDKALDVFYISDASGKKIFDMEKLRAIKKLLEEELKGDKHYQN